MNKNILIPILALLLISFALAESLTIQNIGVSGFNSTNNDYTSSRTVALTLNLSSNANKCSYSNEDLDYSIWESCTSFKYWLLSSSTGNKTVYVKINHTNNSIYVYNHSIYYDYTGAGLDTTPPTGVVFNSKNYTNNNSSITASWSLATDPESDITGISLIYESRVSLNTIPNNTWTINPDRTLTYQINTTENDNITVEVRVTNSAGLYSTTSHNINIDKTSPAIPNITSTATASWTNNNTVFFNWTATDDKSLNGYSYTFTQNSLVEPDNVSEAATSNHTFTMNNDGLYYFKIKSIDSAGNPSNSTTYIVRYDNTAPRRVDIIGSTQSISSNNLTISWDEVIDISTPITYQIQISDVSENFTILINETNTSDTSINMIMPSAGTYYARVRAINSVNLSGVWSNEEEGIFDDAAPIITPISPNGNTARTNPIIIIRTNEDAACEYDGTPFDFTGQKYHETRVTAIPILLTCFDEYNNSGTYSPTYSPTTFVEPLVSNSPMSVYAGFLSKKEITLTNNLYGFETRDFSVKINNVSIPFNIIPTSGANNYTLVFNAPKKGSYTLTINNVDIALTSNDINLTVEYTNALSSPIKKNQIVYATLSSKSIGIMTSSSDNSIVSSTSNLLSTSTSNSKNLVFFTNKINNIEKKEYDFANGDFLNREFAQIGSFGVTNTNKKILLSYDNIKINGSDDFGKGVLNLRIKLLSIIDGVKYISISEKKDVDITVYK